MNEEIKRLIDLYGFDEEEALILFREIYEDWDYTSWVIEAVESIADEDTLPTCRGEPRIGRKYTEYLALGITRLCD